MKKFLQLAQQSFLAIAHNKVRSFLTILGIVIGIGSVIALVSLGSGVNAYITKQIATLGTNTIIVQSGSTGAPRPNERQQGPQSFAVSSTLSNADFTNLTSLTQKAHTNLSSVIGTVSGNAIFANQTIFTVQGVSANIFTVNGYKTFEGNLFTKDITHYSVVLGHDLAANIFGTMNPVGKTLQIQKDTYTVIGVLQSVNASNFNNPNLIAYIPYNAAFLTFDTTKFTLFTVRAIDSNHVNQAKDQIQKQLLADHNIEKLSLADFSVNTSADLLQTVTSITSTLTSLLSGIAAISLLVGGIGIMNIMLVSVTERTREIGLRKALGATFGDIMTQFLIESIILTLIGGILGIALGIGMGSGVGKLIGFEPVLTRQAILLAVGISSLIGILFGLYPAGRAARLNAIDALRYE